MLLLLLFSSCLGGQTIGIPVLLLMVKEYCVVHKLSIAHFPSRQTVLFTSQLELAPEKIAKAGSLWGLGKATCRFICWETWSAWLRKWTPRLWPCQTVTFSGGLFVVLSGSRFGGRTGRSFLGLRRLLPVGAP